MLHNVIIEKIWETGRTSNPKECKPNEQTAEKKEQALITTSRKAAVCCAEEPKVRARIVQYHKLQEYELQQTYER